MNGAISRELIHGRLIGRLLPRVQAVDVWDGPGDGRPCDGCALPVTTLQRAIEAVASRWLSMYCHAQCFDIWESERVVLTRWASSPGESGILRAPGQLVENDRERALLTIPTKEMFAVLVGRGNHAYQRTDDLMVRTDKLLADSDKRLARSGQLIARSMVLLKRCN
jgi:hypothetical protein